MIRRNTKTKERLLETLKASESALSHEILFEKLGKEIDRATIYRILNSFCEDGIAHKIMADDGKQYFAICIGCSEKKHRHNHLHFRCTICGTTECLPGEIKFRLPENYRAENFNGFISGICARCA